MPACVDGCAREWESARSGLCSRPRRTVARVAGRRCRRVPCSPADPTASAAGARARSPPAPGNDATPTGATAGRTSSGCAPPAHATRTWTKPDGGQPNRRSGAAARSVCAACRRWWSPNCWWACSSAAGSTRSRPARPCCGHSATTSAGRQVGSLTDYVPGDDRDLEFTGLANCLIGHARRALSTPETEVTKDEWDLTVFGHNGTVSFTGISQTWLREAAKRWAADDLPKRRVRPGRRTSAGLAVRHHIGCLARLSESLRMRAGPRRTPGGVGPSRHGGVPAPAGLPRIGRPDQRRRPDPGLPRGPRRAHPHPGDGADPPRRARGRTGRGLRHRAGGRARRTRTGRTEPGPAAGNHAAAVRTPGSS